MTIVTIEEETEQGALYNLDPYNRRPSSCYLELDCDEGVLRCGYRIGDGTPFSVGHKRNLRWNIPVLTMESANVLMRRVCNLAQEIVDGYESVYNGHNYVGSFTEDARYTIRVIYEICDRLESDYQVWDASDFFLPSGRLGLIRDFEVTSESDADALAGLLERDALSHHEVHEITDCREFAEWLIAEASELEEAEYGLTIAEINRRRIENPEFSPEQLFEEEK